MRLQSLESTAFALACAFVVAGTAQAQTSDMSINVSGFRLTTNGAEEAAGWTRSIRLSPSVWGKPVSSLIWIVGCGDFVAWVPPDDRDSKPAGAIVGWRLELTPVRVVDKTVTFRLRWSREIITANPIAGVLPGNYDAELTLKPGESRPLDTLAIGAGKPASKSCDVSAASLRVSIDYDTFERRLVSIDVWLVERLSNGKEESQLQSVRGVPHKPVPFYFDSISMGAERYDFSGELIPELENGIIEISVEAIRARAGPSQRGYQAARWFRSTIQLKAGETVEVALKPDRGEAQLLDGRQFSLRIQARQIR